jgi:hypothetical protein
MDFVKFAESKIRGTEFDIGGYYELPRHDDGNLMSYEEVCALCDAFDAAADTFPIINEDTGDISFGADQFVWKQNWDKFLSENLN